MDKHMYKMKIAIGLFGEYNDIYKKNKYNGDIFTYVYPISGYKTDNNIVHTEIIDIKNSNLNNMHLCARKSTIRATLMQNCYEHIHQYEVKHNTKYDVYIFASFKDIILDDLNILNNGIYYAESHPYFCHPYGRLSSIEVLSDKYVMNSDGKIQNIHELEFHIKKKLFDNVYDWDSIPACTTDIAICIPSVISVSNNVLYYTSKRSVFSEQERYEQTLEQLKSLSMLENTTIYLMEGSQLGIKYIDTLSKYCNVILTSTDEKADMFANTHSNKSIYEVYCMKHILEKINCKWLFKFGGRYRLSQIFDIKGYLRDKPVFKIIGGSLTFTGDPLVECVLYSIPDTYHKKYTEIYNNIFEELVHKNQYGGVESLLYKEIKDTDIIYLDYLNVYGKDAIEGNENFY